MNEFFVRETFIASMPRIIRMIIFNSPIMVAIVFDTMDKSCRA